MEFKKPTIQMISIEKIPNILPDGTKIQIRCKCLEEVYCKQLNTSVKVSKGIAEFQLSAESLKKKTPTVVELEFGSDVDSIQLRFPIALYKNSKQNWKAYWNLIQYKSNKNESIGDVIGEFYQQEIGYSMTSINKKLICQSIQNGQETYWKLFYEQMQEIKNLITEWKKKDMINDVPTLHQSIFFCDHATLISVFQNNLIPGDFILRACNSFKESKSKPKLSFPLALTFLTHQGFERVVISWESAIQTEFFDKEELKSWVYLDETEQLVRKTTFTPEPANNESYPTQLKELPSKQLIKAPNQPDLFLTFNEEQETLFSNEQNIIFE